MNDWLYRIISDLEDEIARLYWWCGALTVCFAGYVVVTFIILLGD